MKKYFAYFSLIILLSACSNDDNREFQIDDIVNFNSSIELLEITYSTKDVPMKFEDHKILEIDEQLYLRSNGGGYITTSLLRKNTDGGLTFAGISCRTIHCSSTTGCIPNLDGISCSSCPRGDCEKTVTGGAGAGGIR